MRRPTALLSAAVVVLAACADGPSAAEPSIPPSAPAAPVSSVAPPSTAPLPAPVQVIDEGDGIRRFGEGRALLADFVPDADRVVVATTIGLVVQTGDGEPRRLTAERVELLATSPDDRLAAVLTASGRLELWDVEAAADEPRATATTEPGRFEWLHVGDDGVIVAANDREVVRFRPDGTSEQLLAVTGDTTLGEPAADPRGSIAVPVQGPRPTIAIWTADGAEGEIDIGLETGSRLTGVTWSGDGRHLAVLHAPATGSDTVGIWDVTARRFTGQVPVPNLVLPHQVAFPTHDRVVLPNFDRVVAYALDGAEVAAFPVAASAVDEIDAVGEGVIVSQLDGTLTRWTVDEQPTQLTERTVTLVDQRAGAALTVVDQHGLVRVLDADGTERHRLDRWAVGEATAVDVAGDGALVLATSRGAVRVVGDGEVRAVLDRAEGQVGDVAVDPAGRRLATGVSVQKRAEAWDDTVELTDLATEATVLELGGEAEEVSGCAFYVASVAFSPDGTLLASSSHDFTVQVSPLDDPDATVVLEPHLGTVLDLAWSPDGATLLTSAEDGTLRMWDTDGWRLRAEVPTPAGGWFALAFSPDGSLLAASEVAGTISLLDPATGVVQRSFAGTRAQLGDMAFTPDGARLVAPRADGAVGVWDVGSGELVHELRGHTMPVNDLAVSDDGTLVVTASEDGTVRAWPLPAA